MPQKDEDPAASGPPLDLFADALGPGEREAIDRALKIYRDLRDSGALDEPGGPGCSCSKA